MASFTKTFTLTRVYGERGFTGADGKDIEFIFLRSATDTVRLPCQRTEMISSLPAGRTTLSGLLLRIFTSLYPVVFKANGVWSAFSTPAPGPVMPRMVSHLTISISRMIPRRQFRLTITDV